MAKKKSPAQLDELERREKIKKLVIIAMFSDDVLMERLVLKGGNALDLIHHVSSRASVDIDLSMNGEFTSNERLTLQGRIEKVLRETFRPEGYRVFDVRLHDQPKGLTADLADFLGRVQCRIQAHRAWSVRGVESGYRGTEKECGATRPGAGNSRLTSASTSTQPGR